MEEYLVWGSEGQSFPGAVIESVHDLLQFFRGDGTQVTPLGKVLADQAIGIFVGSAFPGVVGMGEVHTGSQGLGDAFMLGAFGAIIEGQGMDTSAHGAQKLHGRPTEGLSGAVGECGEQGVAAFAFHPGDQHPAVPVADERIAFPVSDPAALIHDRGAGVDADPVFKRPVPGTRSACAVGADNAVSGTRCRLPVDPGTQVGRSIHD